MKLSFFRRSQPVCEEPKMRKIVPQDEIPREVWLKRFIESYRRSNMQMEMLSDYTKSLEQAFQHLLQENHDLKKKNALIRDYMKHLNETGDKEFELKLENRQLKTALNRSNQLLKSAVTIFTTSRPCFTSIELITKRNYRLTPLSLIISTI